MGSSWTNIVVAARGLCSVERVAQGSDRCLKLKSLVSTCGSRPLGDRILLDAEVFDLLVKRGDGLLKLRDLAVGGGHRLAYALLPCGPDRLELVAKRDDRLSQLGDLVLDGRHGALRTSFLFEANRVLETSHARHPTQVLAPAPALPISWWRLTRKQRDARGAT